MSRITIVVIVLVAVLHTITAHLCLFEPPQRGKLPLYHEGNPDCYRAGDPCGGQLPEVPLVSYDGGQQSFIKWQQSYNYYEVGFPGYIDLAVAPYDSDQWLTLAVIQDEYVHEQYHAQNFTAVVVLPNMDCPHCVLRIRYNSHKPGQDILYQCSDITIRQIPNDRVMEVQRKPPTKSKSMSIKRAFDLHLKTAQSYSQEDGPFLHGFAYNRFDIDTLHYVKVSVKTGELQQIYKYEFGMTLQRRKRRSPRIQKAKESANIGDAPLSYIADAVLAHNPSEQKTGLMFHEGVNLDHPPNYLLEINSQSGEIIKKVPLRGTDGTAINALLAGRNGNYITFSIHQAGEEGKYYFAVGQLTPNGEYSPITKTDTPEEMYINYYWSEYNKQKNQLYVLMGKNNDYELKTRIYTFDITNRTLIASSEMDTYLYTFESMQLFEQTGKLYALSPEHSRTLLPYWHLVEIDPYNGIVNRYMDITDAGVFGGHYGGTIFGGIDQSKGLLYHVLHVAETEADVIVTIDIVNKNVTFSPMMYLRHLHNINIIEN